MSPESEKRVLQLVDQQNQEAKNAVALFYPNGILPDFSHSSEQHPLVSLLAQAKAPPDPQAPPLEQLIDQCFSVRSHVKSGTPGYIEVQLNMARQLSERQEFPLRNTVIKVWPTGASKPEFLFIKAGDTVEATIFLGGNNAWGIMVLRDENGEDQFLRLSEFHLLSLRENPDPHKEVGLITSYLGLTTKVYSSVIFASSLNPIKSLLLSDWLQSEWQRAKDVASKSPDKVGGGENNE